MVKDQPTPATDHNRTSGGDGFAWTHPEMAHLDIARIERELARPPGSAANHDAAARGRLPGNGEVGGRNGTAATATGGVKRSPELKNTGSCPNAEAVKE